MVTYTRGDNIPPEKRDWRFVYKEKPSANALNKYWRLLPDGSPDPCCAPFPRRTAIEMLHRAYPKLGEYKIDSKKVGRPKKETPEPTESW